MTAARLRAAARIRTVSRHVHTGTSICRVTTRLLSSEAPSRNGHLDVIVVGVVKGADGPELGPGADGVNQALGGSLIAELTALGATGRAGQVTQIATGSRLAAASEAGAVPLAPLIFAVGLGKPAAEGGAFDHESLRRAAGAAVRTVVRSGAKPVRDENTSRGEAGSDSSAPVRRVGLALPARDEAEAEAVALGGLLGGYSFWRYRTTPPRPSVELTLLDDGALSGEAARRVQTMCDA